MSPDSAYRRQQRTACDRRRREALDGNPLLIQPGDLTSAEIEAAFQAALKVARKTFSVDLPSPQSALIAESRLISPVARGLR